jgi:hypothetical protein
MRTFVSRLRLSYYINHVTRYVFTFSAHFPLQCENNGLIHLIQGVWYGLTEKAHLTLRRLSVATQTCNCVISAQNDKDRLFIHRY